MALVDDLKTISSDLDTLKAVVEGVIVGETAVPEPSLGDKVLEAVLPVLTAAGYTAPVVEAPAEVETPAEETTEPAEEAPSA